MPVYTIESGNISLAAGTALTALQLTTPSTRRGELIELGISFSDTTATDAPGLIELRTQSTAGTSSSFTPSPDDPAEPASLCTARNTFTAEPTDVALMYPGPWRLTPVGGLFVYQFDGKKIPISTSVGVRLTYPNNQSNVRVYLKFKE
jgi:hypothetical protein